MKASAATVRHELDAPTMWGRPSAVQYRDWRDPDDRRDEPKRRRRRYWKETAMSDEVEYLICFDFPDMDDPCFAGWAGNGTLGITPTMRTATRFETWEIAERWLQNNYPSSREFGAVVEISPARAG